MRDKSSREEFSSEAAALSSICNRFVVLRLSSLLTQGSLMMPILA
jgi:hypothetical protein